MKCSEKVFKLLNKQMAFDEAMRQDICPECGVKGFKCTMGETKEIFKKKHMAHWEYKIIWPHRCRSCGFEHNILQTHLVDTGPLNDVWNEWEHLNSTGKPTRKYNL